MDNVCLNMAGITKIYGNTAAIEDVDFSVRKGEVHALIGENGAGKSTLLNILSGVRNTNAGKIELDGEEVHIKNPLSARELGIAMIHQELQHVPELSVAQNIFLGRPLTKNAGLLVDKKSAYKKSKEILQRLDPTIDPKTPIKELRVAQQQIVEIARALLDNARVIAMDEPTSSLTPTEFERLAEIIADLRSEGVALIYVSHKMDEIFKVADRATILRDGKQVGVVNIEDEDEDSIVVKMVGRDIKKVTHQSFMTDKNVLTIEGLTRGEVVKPASFNVRAGEVLGIAGLVGSGRTELLKLIAGIDSKSGGKMYVNDKEIPHSHVLSSIKSGIGLVPEDRKKEGIIRERSVAVNAALPSLKKYAPSSLIQEKELKKDMYNVMEELNLRPLNIEKAIGTLSGGNQQKVIIGRWVAAHTQVFLFDEPTRGIDIGAKSEIYNLIEKLAQEGKAIIVVSSEMPEIIRISDRVLVMREGSITAELIGDDINEENIARYAISDIKKL